jgi:hypothetical protein
VKKVYIAGQYRGFSQERTRANIDHAYYMGMLVAERGATRGFAPLIPHMNSAEMELVTDKCDHQYWLDATMAMMRGCKAILMIPGWQDSPGACEELVEAQRLGMEVYYDYREIT